MKKGILILLVALIAGYLAFFFGRSQPAAVTDHVMLDSLPELAWLRTDLKLTDKQFAEVSAHHREYRPVCAEMCSRIADSEAVVTRIATAQRGMSDELTKAIENHGQIIAECKRSMLTHIYQTAALMDDDQARRYLDTTLPLALDSVRSGAASKHHE